MPASVRSTLLPIVVAATCTVVAAHMWVSQRQADSLSHAQSLLARGQYEDAIDASEKVTRPPDQTRARQVEAFALTQIESPAAASLAYSRAVARDPNNSFLRRDRAVVLAGLGRRDAARRQMSRAIALNPLLPLPPTFKKTR